MTSPPSDEEIKEVYAQFGLAYYFSEVLHRGLCNAYAITPFKTAEDASRLRIEERLEFAWSTTLGQMVNRVDETFLSKEIERELQDAVDKRNYLAHYFWFENIHKLTSKAGVRELLAELNEVRNLFQSLDERVDAQVEDRLQALGITTKQVNHALQRVLSGDDETELHDQRTPQKQERIVHAYDLPDRNAAGVVFETRDGELWQLSDVGLAWTPFNQPGEDWVDNEQINSYLPATIDPRPEVKSPFNYTIQLSGGKLLCSKERGTMVCKVIEDDARNQM